MPFKSEKQRRYLWANEPEVARKFAKYNEGGNVMPGILDKKGQDLTITIKKPNGASVTYKSPEESQMDMSGILGGMVEGYTPTPVSDNTMIKVTPGEFVVNQPAAQKYQPLLEKINEEGKQALAMGGWTDSKPMGYAGGGFVVNDGKLMTMDGRMAPRSMWRQWVQAGRPNMQGYAEGGSTKPAWATATGKLGFGPFAINVYRSEDGTWRREDRSPLPGYQQNEIKDIQETPIQGSTSAYPDAILRPNQGGQAPAELSAPGVRGAEVIAQKGTPQYEELVNNPNYVEQGHFNPHLSTFRLTEAAAEGKRDQDVLAEDYASVSPELRQQAADYELYDRIYRENPERFDLLLKNSEPGSNIQKFAQEALGYSPFAIKQGVSGALNQPTGPGLLGGIGNPGGQQRAAQGSNIVNPQGGARVQDLLDLGQAAQTVKDLGQQDVLTGTADTGFQIRQINFSASYGTMPSEDPTQLAVGSRATNDQTGEVWEVR